MHSINEIDCYFSSLKVIFDIDFFGASLLFIFICISTWFLSNIRLFNKAVFNQGPRKIVKWGGGGANIHTFVFTEHKNN